jgi:hypothetical protein
MKKFLIAAVAVTAMAFAGSAAAALVPGVYDPGNTSCPKVTYAHGVLHLEKNCATATNAAAGADITGLDGQTFTSASFTLASMSQCQGGSPRFDIQTTTGLFYLGCNNVAPVTNPDGSATYTFTAATLAAAGQQVPTPTGTITAADVLIDVQGSADIAKISVNDHAQKLKDACKKDAWKSLTNPAFKNQGQCVSYFKHQFKPLKAKQGDSASDQAAKAKKHK